MRKNKSYMLPEVVAECMGKMRIDKQERDKRLKEVFCVL